MILKRFSLIGLIVAASFLVAACEVPNPTPSDMIPAEWGDSLMPSHRDVPYTSNAFMGCVGWGSDEPCAGSQTLDIYPVAQGGTKGTLVFVHGGGFIYGDKFPMGQMGVLRRMTHLGWDVVSVNYRLARNPQFSFPAAIQDVNASLVWLRANGSSYGINTERVVVSGHSVGGTLAMLAGVGGNSGRPEFGDTPPLSGWVSLSGITNFQSGPFSRGWGQLWMGERFEQLWQIASPKTWIDSSDPKGYLIHGDLDSFVEYGNSLEVEQQFSKYVHFDSVNFLADNEPMSPVLRGHMPMQGMNAKEFYSWADNLPTLHGFANPFGSLDAVTPQVGGIQIKGWAIDPDTTSPVEVHVYVDGRYTASGVASNMRKDVAKIHPAYGSLHGYDIKLPASSGSRSVCVYAINVSIGVNNPIIGCRIVQVP